MGNRAALSATDAHFLEWAAETPEARDPSRHAPTSAASRQGKFQAWPAFVRRSDASLQTDVVRAFVARLLASTERASAMGLLHDPESLEACDLLRRRDPEGRQIFTRAEFVRGADGWTCVEFAITGAMALGSAWLNGLVGAQVLASEVLRPFLERHRDEEFAITNPALALLRRVLAGTTKPGVVLAMGRPLGLGYFDEQGQMFTETVLNAQAAQIGGDPRRIVVRPADALRFVDGAIRVDGVDAPVAAVMDAQFAFVHDPSVPWHAVFPQVMEAVRADVCPWFVGPAARLLSDRRLIANTIESLEQADDEEARWLARHIAWTRVLRPGKVRFRGDDVELLELLGRAREDLVLKPHDGGGVVQIGGGMSDAQWDDAVRELVARAGDAVVSEHVAPVERPQLGSDGRVFDGWLIFSSFVFGGEDGGLSCRVGPHGTLPLTFGGAAQNPLDQVIPVLVHH